MVLIKALQAQQVSQCYGIIGIPIIELSVLMHSSGIIFYGFRNEQGASYAAGVEGYLTGRPGICLTVSGPGFTNALSGLANAKENSWPMILISGSSEIEQIGMGAFQEFPQSEAATSFCKWSVRVSTINMIPRVVETAFRVSMTGRPGPVYIDLPADLLRANIPDELSALEYYKPPLLAPDLETVQNAVQVLKSAQRPLVIIGKGTAYSRADTEILEFINTSKIPFLPTPMGKGMISDENELCVSAARSTALAQADVILLLGARLNWILHYGHPPRFSPDVKFISVNIDPQELSNNKRAQIEICADIKLFLKEANKNLKNWKFSNQAWIDTLSLDIKKNLELASVQLNSPSFNYYKALTKINKFVPKDAMLITEGSNTMDIARTVVLSYKPRSRVDAGSFGTMGVAIPACIVCKVLYPHRPVIAVVGDSSFGFSGMELETATRYGLDFTVFIINNNGIAAGYASIPSRPKDIMPNALNPATKYELLAEAFGGKGHCAFSETQLEEICQKTPQFKGLQLINVKIDPESGKKPQKHFWLSSSTPKL
jgi:2-hydroxyacyl-CoA lyase 1